MIDGGSYYRHGNRRRDARRVRRTDTHANYASIAERLAALETGVEALLQAHAAGGAALSETLERLEKQLSRSGRELFKANALAETQQKNTETALEQLRDAATYHERELAQLRERLAQANDEGRLDVIRKLFPALDGLEEALASGRRLQRAAQAPPPPPSFWQRLNPAQRAAPAVDLSAWQSIAAWLDGLDFVRARLLAALAAEKVVPILTEGQDFDPHRHVAVEAVPATDRAAPGTIVRENRRGYVRGDTVLRYADVVVARAPLENSL